MQLTSKDRAILRWDGKKWQGYVCLEWQFDAMAQGLEGQTPEDTLRNAMQAASIKRELGEAREDIPTPAVFAATRHLESVPSQDWRTAMVENHDTFEDGN